jgi:pyruvate dehydrogenase E2 component (dihydrolipoamide acetyltransferase)
MPFTGTRRAIADRLRRVLSTAAPVTLTREIDAEALWTVREQLKTGFPGGLPFDAIFVKVIAASLVEYPALNAMIDGDEIVRFDHVHVGVAVATPDGLYVPVVREAETRVLSEIAPDIIRLSGKARARRLSGDDLSGGTVAITNLGNYGVDAFTPIINPPQSAILGIGRILQRAVVRDGQLTARRTCALSLTFDHRVADGAPAAQLLDAIASKLEDEGRLRGLLDA